MSCQGLSLAAPSPYSMHPGAGFLEKVYKSALAHELRQGNRPAALSAPQLRRPHLQIKRIANQSNSAPSVCIRVHLPKSVQNSFSCRLAPHRIPQIVATCTVNRA
jgi:hypothetical protein